jgi:hypothetical protein
MPCNVDALVTVGPKVSNAPLSRLVHREALSYSGLKIPEALMLASRFRWSCATTVGVCSRERARGGFNALEKRWSQKPFPMWTLGAIHNGPLSELCRHFAQRKAGEKQ